MYEPNWMTFWKDRAMEMVGDQCLPGGVHHTCVRTHKMYNTQTEPYADYGPGDDDVSVYKCTVR